VKKDYLLALFKDNMTFVYNGMVCNCMNLCLESSICRKIFSSEPVHTWLFV